VPSSNLTVSIHGEALPSIGKLTMQELKEQNIEFSCAAVSTLLCPHIQTTPTAPIGFQGDNCNDLLGFPLSYLGM
jgi:hypothetical protein